MPKPHVRAPAVGGAVTAESDKVGALVHQARAAVAERRLHDALQLCDRAALVNDEGRYLAARLRGDILLELGDARGALSSYDSVAQPERRDAALDLSRGLALFELARMPEAENALRSALRDKPDAAEGHFALGIIAEMEGKGAQQEHFRRARRLDPARYPPLPRLSAEQFGEVVTAAVAKLSEPLQAKLRGVPLLVAEMPNAADLARQSPPISPLSFLMRVSVRTMGPLGEVTPGVPGTLSQALLLFKRNLERSFVEPEKMVDAVAQSLADALDDDDEGDDGPTFAPRDGGDERGD